MPVLLESNANFSEDEERFLQFVSSDQFPWYLTRATPNFSCMVHTLLNRTDKREEGAPWSPHYPAARMVFDRICKDNGIVVKDVYRMAFNLTFPDPSKHGDPHNDHDEWPHKIMIIYLSKFDEGGTWLFDNDRNVETIVKAELDKFVIFDGGIHANGFCKPQQTRTVFVATFDGDILPKEQVEAA
jgi:hypothetical protein